ncbi:MAG: apolipoprotein N-acyltransferase [Pseudomonadota bacterium]
MNIAAFASHPNRMVGHGAALLAGAVLPLAFAPFEWRFLAFLSPAVLFILWANSNAADTIRRSFIFGVGLFSTGTYWIYYSLHLFGDAIAPLAAIITVGFVLFFSGYYALMGWVLARYFPIAAFSTGLPRLLWWTLAAPSLWTACELFRAWFLTGFPWLALGYSQVDTPLAGYAPVLGVFGVSWLVAISAGVLAFIATHWQSRNLLAVLAVVVFWLGGFFLNQFNWTRPAGDPISVRIVQGNIAQHHKFLAELLKPSIAKYQSLSRIDEPVDLIVWPESAIPTFFYKIDKHLEAFTQRASANGIRIITGGFVYNPSTSEYHNSMRALDDANAVYHKQHLVPFGEYMPFRSVLGLLSGLITIPMADLSPGDNSDKRLEIKGYQIGASICYEDAFGEELARAFPDAALLLNMSNDSWFGDSSAPHQHLEIAKMRALELQRPMVRVTNTGVSTVMDYRGKIRALIESDESGAVDSLVTPREGRTPYSRLTNGPVIGLVLCVIFYVAWVGWRRTTRKTITQTRTNQSAN